MKDFSKNGFSGLARKIGIVSLMAICFGMFSTITNGQKDATSKVNLNINAVAIAPNGVSNGILISQVYGGAGCGTAGCSTYQNDFIELYNRANTPISVNGWSVQYAAATGTAWQVTPLPNVTIQPGKYFLVAESFGANGVNPLPAPDVAGTIAMSATAAKVALVNTTTALSGACPSSATIIDFVGYGATANCFEGTGAAPAPSTTTADIRNASGSQDTDQNATDFQALAPTPRNSSSAASSASTLTNANSKTFTIGSANTFSVTTTGTPTVTTITESGTLPPNVTFTDNGNGTGTLSGTAATATPGTFTITFTAFNGVYTVQTFTLTVSNAVTAAMVNVGGRVTGAKGRGIFGAVVTMTDGNGNSYSAVTNSSGDYLFEDVEVGQTLIFNARSKGYNFTQPTQVVSLTEETITVNFTGYESRRIIF